MACPASVQTEERRRLNRLQPDTPESVEYMGQRIPRPEYEARTKKQALIFQSELKKRFRLEFKIRRFKYFVLACRCNVKRRNHLQFYTEQFFKQIYPRYFRYEPRQIFKIVYFKNRKEMFKVTGRASYGYYTFKDRTFYTYVGSGHGTLWHEMMHAFIHAEYSGSRPQWFEEGLASFYEMAFLDARGRLKEGYANWRLPGMQKRLRAGKIAALSNALQNYAFNDQFHYAEARWFFAYLWMESKLDRFVIYYLNNLQNIRDPHQRFIALQSYLQSLLGKKWTQIENEYRATALRAKKNQKLTRRRH